MHIVCVVPLYPPHSLVGAWITTHEHLRHLASRGHEVSVTTYLTGRHAPYTLDGVRVVGRQAPDADLVVAHLGDNGSGRDLADRLGVPLVYMAHGAIDDPTKLDGCALAVFNSHTLREEAGWGGPSIVAWPTVNPADYATTPGDRITLVNLSRAKGGDLFWLISAALPRRTFLAVAGGYGRQIVRVQPNTRVERKPVADMRTVYERTRIVLMPSAKESWGRVAMEAACSGIPTIAHPTPGIVEAMGDAALYADRGDIAEWFQQIEALDDPDVYEEASQRALERTRLLNPTQTLADVAEAIEALAPVPA